MPSAPFAPRVVTAAWCASCASQCRLPCQLALVVVILITYLNPLRMLAKLPINIGNLVVSGTKITMEQPRLSGFTRDARAYELTRRRRGAGYDQARYRRTAQHPRQGRNAGQEHDGAQCGATGLYDAKAETLKLERDIVLTSSTGYQGRLSEALVDIRKGNVVSEHPVEVRLLAGYAQCQPAGDCGFRRAHPLPWRCRHGH